jgi:hypothetical protein
MEPQIRPTPRRGNLEHHDREKHQLVKAEASGRFFEKKLRKKLLRLGALAAKQRHSRAGGNPRLSNGWSDFGHEPNACVNPPKSRGCPAKPGMTGGANRVSVLTAIGLRG